MEDLIKRLLKIIDSYSVNKIEIRPYCKKKLGERNVDEELLVSTLFSKSLYYVEIQEKLFEEKSEKRYKLVFKISSKYSLIIVVAFYPKNLKIINVIKTSKSAEKKWRNEIL